MKFWTGSSPPGRLTLGTPDGFPPASRLLRSGGTFRAIPPAAGPRWLSGLRIVVVAGMAGSGKTSLLRDLAGAGAQTLDLEALANHRGSVFGGLGAGPQPSHRDFQAAVARVCGAADRARILWVEDEGPFIGSVGLPVDLVDAMAGAPAVALAVPRRARIGRLLDDYGGHPRDDLIRAVSEGRRRIGRRRAARVAGLVAGGDLGAAVDALLPYYDGAYRHRIARCRRPWVTSWP